MREDERRLMAAVMQTCIEHGFDPAAFVILMNECFGLRIASPEEALPAELRKFMRASLGWNCPGDTALMDRRRRMARAAWAQTPFAMLLDRA